MGYADHTRRRSKRQKDLADILGIIERYPEFKTKLPPSLQEDDDEGENMEFHGDAQ